MRPACENQKGVCQGAKKPIQLCVGGKWNACAATDYQTYSSLYVDATETRCDDKDDDCDGTTDEGCDDDADGYCDNGMTYAASGTAPKACDKGKGDCDDKRKDVHPGALETCDDVDQDCSGTTDEGCDDDNDSWCDAAMVMVGKPKACSNGGGDCNDKDKAVNPGAQEGCSTVDEDCDGKTDAADNDLDKVRPSCEKHYGVCQGAKKPVQRCIGGVWTACTTADYQAYSSLYDEVIEKRCDDTDNDCDNTTDEGCDDDGDGYCDAALSTTGKPKACPNGGGDCHDSTQAANPYLTDGKHVHPGKKEDCGTAWDDNCNLDVNEQDATACTTFYKDADGDGWAASKADSGCYCAAKKSLFLTADKLGDCDDASNATSSYSWKDAQNNVIAIGEKCVGGVCGLSTVACDGKLAACGGAGTVPSGAACCASLSGTYGGSCLSTDSKGVKWGLVPSGTFWMGCNAALDKSCQAAEKAQHEVEVTQAYWLGVYEVTVAQYKDCVDAGKCSAPAGSSASEANWNKAGREQHPVNFVSWSKALAYCQWVGGSLPTEAQWELAARGRCDENGGISGCADKMRLYPWGNETATCEYAVMDDHVTTGSASGTSGCGERRTWAVGSKPKGAGPYGMHDMAGNVYEWVTDWYATSYPSHKISHPQGGTGPANGFASYRAARSSVFNGSATVVRAGIRNGYSPSDAYFIVGFRCARSFP